jgi:mycofactocin glycosyltransferase
VTRQLTRPVAGAERGPAPLPPGFHVVFDPQTQFVGADVLFGGSPPRLLRLNPAGQRALAELRRGPVCSPAAGKLARRLTDTGMAHPRPPAGEEEPAGGGPPATGDVRGPGPGAAGVVPRESGAGGRPPGPVLPDVTVVIPARDRPAYLDRCLTALGRTYPVVVVDDGSRQAAEIAGLCRQHGATLIRRSSSGGPGPARNGGLAQVRTPLVAFLDSDCEAGPEWITSLAAHFADPLVAAVAPRVRPITGPGSAGRYLGARAPLDMGPQEGRVLPLTRLSYVPTAALLVRRAALASDGPETDFPAGARSSTQPSGTEPSGTEPSSTEPSGTEPSSTAPVGAGPFDADLRYGEDVDLVWRLAEAGWRVRYDPAASISHAEPATWGRVLGRRFRYGNSAAPLARRHPGKVPPLVLQAWPALAVAALLARRPAAALAAYGAGTGQLVQLLRGWDVPPKGVLRPMADSVRQTWLGAGRWTIQYALPVAAATLARPGGRTARTRLGRRLAVASLLAGPPLAEWWRIRPPLNATAFSLGYLADEAAYGAGVYRGVLTERLLSPLLPAVAWRPLGKAPAATRPDVPPGKDPRS